MRCMAERSSGESCRRTRRSVSSTGAKARALCSVFVVHGMVRLAPLWITLLGSLPKLQLRLDVADAVPPAGCGPHRGVALLDLAVDLDLHTLVEERHVAGDGCGIVERLPVGPGHVLVQLPAGAHREVVRVALVGAHRP